MSIVQAIQQKADVDGVKSVLHVIFNKRFCYVTRLVRNIECFVVGWITATASGCKKGVFPFRLIPIRRD